MKFENQGTSWAAEFEVKSSFNLHVERVSGGRFLVYQKSVKDAEYDIVDGVGNKDHKKVIDTAVRVDLFPMWCKIVSESEVTMAVVNPDGAVVPTVKFRTEYDASIYEDRKALWEYFDAFGMQQDEQVTLEKEIAVTNTVAGDALVYKVGKVYTGGTITMWSNVEILNLHGDEGGYEITAE